MASLGGVSSSNTLSSLMNSANMISGLASGLDTEGMIESLVKSYQSKISQFSQKVTKLEWKQDAYRSIISKMYNFSNKYTSYTSSTNLMSTSFFSSAVRVAALGKFADAVSATGKTTSSVSLNAVHQLATAAQYRTTSNLTAGDGRSIESSRVIDLAGETSLSKLNGNLTLTYGSQTVTVSFDQVKDVEAIEEIIARREEAGQSATDEEVLADLINQKLAGQMITLTGGGSADITDRLQVTARNGVISFSDKSTAGNSVYISGVSGNVGSVLGITDALKEAKAGGAQVTSFESPYGLTKKQSNITYLSGKSMNVSVDGTTKSISLPSIYSSDSMGDFILSTDGSYVDYNAKNYVDVLNDSLQAAFKGKVKVVNTLADPDSPDYDPNYDPTTSTEVKLRFEVQEGSDLIINTDVGETLGIGRTATSYMNTNKTLGEVLGQDAWSKLTPNGQKDKYGSDMYDFVINGVKVGSYSKNSTLAELMSDINKSDAGVTVSYSQTTKKFLFESKSTGTDSEITMGNGLAKAMFGEDYGNVNISDILQNNNITSRSFKFTIYDDNGEGTEISGEFASDGATMNDLLEMLKEKLESTNYEAVYDPTKGLYIKDNSTGNEADVRYGDDALGAVVNAAKPKNIYNENKKLTEILGEEEIQNQRFEFSINGETFSGKFSGNDGTIQNLLNKINSMLDSKEEYKDYKAYYERDRGLVIKRTKEDGTEEYVDDVKYGTGDDGKPDVLARLAEKMEVKDHSEAKLVDVLGTDELPQRGSLDITVNDKTYTVQLTEKTKTMDDLLATINEMFEEEDIGYRASFSNMTGDLIITDQQGREAKLEYTDDSALGRIMKAYQESIEEIKQANKEGSNKESVYTKGQDAIFDVTVNGEQIQMKRSSNDVNIDGLTITLKDTFNSKAKVDEEGNELKGQYEVDDKKESVTFKSSTDSDKIIDVIKAMVEDYNAMMAEIKSAYMTMPYQKSGGTFADYEPLTDEEMEGMTESAIARYEEKAKQGILFGDRTLSALYTKMNQAFSFSNTADVNTLKEMGISVSYNVSDGAQAITLDEDKLRAMLDSDPDRVADLFTKTDGMMDRMKTQLDIYAKTTGEPKGVLVQQAGSPLSSLSLLSNTWQKQIDNYTTQIEKWQSKLESQVERYTSQFARLEQLVAQMNNQSSTLAGLMGGGY